MRIDNQLKNAQFSDNYEEFLKNFFASDYICNHHLSSKIKGRIENPYLLPDYVKYYYVHKWLWKNYDKGILDYTYKKFHNKELVYMKMFHLLDQKKAFSIRLFWTNKRIKFIDSDYDELSLIVKISDLISRYSLKKNYPDLRNFIQSGCNIKSKILKFNLLIVLEVLVESILNHQINEFVTRRPILKKSLRSMELP